MVSIKREATLEETLRANLYSTGHHTYWVKPRPKRASLIFKFNRRQVNVVRSLWELHHGRPSAYELRRVCNDRDCVQPEHFRENFSRLYRPSRPVETRSAEDYIWWNETGQRWQARILFQNEPVIDKKYSKGDYMKAVEEVQEAVRTVRKLRQEAYTKMIGEKNGND